MKRAVLCLLFAVALAAAVIAFASCGEKGDPGKASGSGTATEAVTAEAPGGPAVVKGWFDLGSALYRRDKFTEGSSGSVTIDMAKNEIEGFQYLVTSDRDVSGLRCDLPALTDGNGNSLEGEVNVVWYTYVKKTGAGYSKGLYPVAMLPMDDEFQGGSFDVAGNTCRTIYVKFRTTAETVPGTYTGKLALSRDGETLLTGDVTVRVRNVYYDEKTECLSLFGFGHDTGDSNPALPKPPETAPKIGRQSDTGEFDEELTMKYADFMLENRMCPTTLPIKDELLNSDFELVKKYMDNDRYNSVQINSLPWTYPDKERSDNLRAQYKIASENGWVGKCYFGSYDEPLEESHMQALFANVRRVMACFPTTNFLDAFGPDIPSGGRNIVERMSDYSTVYCPNTVHFNGAIRDSMLKLKAERGDTLFWYVCSVQTYDTTDLLPSTPGTDKRMLFWQQYQQNVDGFLYWRVTFWHFVSDVWAENYVEDSIEKYSLHVGLPTDPPTDDGVLIYWHPITKDPVTTLGLEAVRDGIEDFQLLRMAERVLGREKVLEFAEQLTTDVNQFVRYKEGSTEKMADLRSQLFDLLESAQAS
ncbi:MAG: DUF4091 domain-containing protein [Clostridia bacterium]|nr:DUF4091 domain-containing protein [Clostridia bacterium]